MKENIKMDAQYYAILIQLFFHSLEIIYNFHTWEYGGMLFTQFDFDYIVNVFFPISGPILFSFFISKLKVTFLSACCLAWQTTLFLHLLGLTWLKEMHQVGKWKSLFPYCSGSVCHWLLIREMTAASYSLCNFIFAWKKGHKI